MPPTPRARTAAPWLSALPEHAELVSGAGSYVHYGCASCGFRLAHFERPLGPNWTPLVVIVEREEEPVRLWRLSRVARGIAPGS